MLPANAPAALAAPIAVPPAPTFGAGRTAIPSVAKSQHTTAGGVLPGVLTPAPRRDSFCPKVVQRISAVGILVGRAACHPQVFARRWRQTRCPLQPLFIPVFLSAVCLRAGFPPTPSASSEFRNLRRSDAPSHQSSLQTQLQDSFNVGFQGGIGHEQAMQQVQGGNVAESS